MIRSVIFFLLILSSIAWADEKEDQRNVYDVFSDLDKLVKPSQGSRIVTLEEDVTSRIKRYMANLLYPVDMSSFVRPEKDPKFRELVVTLQKQMGEAATGTLTNGQFDKLQEAARNIDENAIYVAAGKLVYGSDDGNSVGALGTGAMNDLAHPININRMLCVRSEGTCEMSASELDLKGRMLIAAPPMIFDIKTWTPNRITAVREHPCGTASLTVDVQRKDVTITSVPHADLPFCSNEPANIWTLVDGFNVVWNLYRDRYHKVRELVYEPAKKFFPIRVPAN
jgi:hypothetical protein